MRLRFGIAWWILVLVSSLPPTTSGSSSLRERLQRNPKTPPRTGKEPLNVNIGVYIESLGKFQAAEMSFDVDLYLYSSWRDPSLNHTNADYVLISDYKVKDHIWMPDLYFSVCHDPDSHMLKVPVLRMLERRSSTTLRCQTSVSSSHRMARSPTRVGKRVTLGWQPVIGAFSVTLTVACNLNLVHYPMDQQTCTIRTLSYAHVASEVNVTWFLESPIRYNPGIGLPEFVIADIHHAYCDGTYMYAIMDKSYKIDRFSCLEGIIHLRRSIGYHVVQSFIPTGLIVMISWVSFWIDRRAVPARVTLSFTTLLSLSTLGNGLRFGLPQVSYAKSIDLWFGACMFFVFASLLEYAIINSYMRQADKYEKLAKQAVKKPIYNKYSASPSTAKMAEIVDRPNMGAFIPRNDAEEPFADREAGMRNRRENSDFFKPIDESPTGQTLLSDEEWADQPPPPFYRPSAHQPSSARSQRAKKPKGPHDKAGNPMQASHFLQMGFEYSRKALRIDKRSRIVFPVAFLLFNIAYWTYYLWYVVPAQPV
ncbi:Protein LGC-41 b [Aphelenchoides avenae]|nr:Protein LGC-41 b [Aphelenchus avenae]